MARSPSGDRGASRYPGGAVKRRTFLRSVMAGIAALVGLRPGRWDLGGSMPVSFYEMTNLSSTTDAQQYITELVDPANNQLVLVWVHNNHASAAGTVTVSGGGIDVWTELATTTWNNGRAR